MVRKGERGKGMGHWIFCLHRTLCLGLSNTQLPFIPHTTPTHLHHQQPTKCGDWVQQKQCLDAAQKFAFTHTKQGLPIVCGQPNIAPSPSPFPLFSPMGRLLSSWPAHGEKKGKGEGDGALYFLFAQDSLSGLGTVFFCGHRNLYLGLPLLQ